VSPDAARPHVMAPIDAPVVVPPPITIDAAPSGSPVGPPPF